MSSKTVFRLIGASNHSEQIRQYDDYYATHPDAVRKLLSVETFSKNIWEPACGECHISDVLESNGYIVRSSDIIQRSRPCEVLDFLSDNSKDLDCDIITNPPYKFATDFVYRSMSCVADGHKIAMLLKLTFLESVERKKLFEEYPFKFLYVFSKRISCCKNGDFTIRGANQSAIAYGWFVWEKGYDGECIIQWI